MKLKQTLILLSVAAVGLTACQPKPAAPTEPAATVASTDTTDVLTYETAKKYVSNYERRAGTVDSIKADGVHIPMPNSRSIWFPKAKLETMLANLKKENGDGVRFYFASYNPKLGTGKNAGKHEGYNTLVMVSTVPKDTLGQKGLHWDSYSKPNANGAAGGLIIGAGAGPENRGEMCPPPSNCPGTGATLIQ